jgi:hypothetical protein
MVPKINTPCPENWDKMNPENQGRFCSACAKIVVDFTQKTTEEIINFLSARKDQEVCGRVKKSALIPVPVRSAMKVFVAALYFVFGSLLFTSCGPDGDEEVMGKMCVDSSLNNWADANNDSVRKADSIALSESGSDTSGIDSAEIMKTINILDSIAELKNK